MALRHYKNHSFLFFCFLLVGCQEKYNGSAQLKDEITKQVPGSINFANISSNKWSRVCFFGPYTLKSTDVLGFEWEVTDHTDVGFDDSINVIVFATETNVTEFVVIPRNKGDFRKLSRHCFPKNDSLFIYEQGVHSYVHKNT